MQHADAALNGDMQRRVVVDCNCMDWSLAPGGQVWRKRLHRVGPAEGGQVTSLVRYVPGARFHAHEHPDGEEILVLEGHFCDEHERSGPGSYLLHPQGFSHAPFSEDGCLLFVKLRQYAGPGRVRVRRDTENITWQTTDEPGVMHKRLYED
ncbi:MAG: cupin domain-containing protein, partial [Salinisphaera sp.]|nr:cupin domain-containing protein [Salinisphaera sp.]